jgi:hypothetical protein
MFRWLAALLSLPPCTAALAGDLVPLTQTNRIEDQTPLLDIRCSALYLALKKLSETGETGNDGVYRDTAAAFLGFAVKHLAEEEGLTSQIATEKASSILPPLIDAYWQQFVLMAKQLTVQEDFESPILAADVPFCLERDKLHLSGTLQ